MKLKYDTLVNYNIAGTIGTAFIVGIAQNPMPVVGHIYILRDTSGNFPNDTYEYDTFVCPECYFSLR